MKLTGNFIPESTINKNSYINVVLPINYPSNKIIDNEVVIDDKFIGFIEGNDYRLDDLNLDEILKKQMALFDAHIESVNHFKEILFSELKYDSNQENPPVSMSRILEVVSKKIGDYPYLDKLQIINEQNEVNVSSLINYLYICVSRKMKSVSYDILIDDNHRIVIYYDENKKKRDSKKINIVVNEKDFIISILSRQNGLAKFSGICTLRFPDGYYKFDLALRALL